MEVTIEKSVHFKPKYSRNNINNYHLQSNRYKSKSLSNINLNEYDNSHTSPRIKFSSLGSQIIKSNNNYSSQILDKNNSNTYNNYSIFKTNLSYDPYLMKVCKNAIINNRDQLPNYLEIITKINKEFNIDEFEEAKLEEEEEEFLQENMIINKNDISIAETNIHLNENPIQKVNIKDENEEKLKEEERIKKEIEKEKEEHRKLEIRKKRKRILINIIRFLSSNNIKINDYNSKKIFPENPFELRGSEEFIDAVKFNNYELVEQAIKKNKNYLIQFDYNKQTAFHWAAKLGYDKILKLLCENCDIINLYDKKLRTPIYLAALFNQINCIEILLEYGANAYICDIYGKKPIDVTTNNKAKKILNSAVEKSYMEIYNKKNNND